MTDATATRFDIRAATADDLAALTELLPRLADFDIPPGRNPLDLWRSDEKTLRRHLSGESSDTLCHVAERDGRVLGFVLTSLRPELLSGEPSAHLEAIAVHTDAARQGLATRLIEATESAAAARGARSITLHVFARNERARALYRRCGYDEELIRCSRDLGSRD